MKHIPSFRHIQLKLPLFILSLIFFSIVVGTGSVLPFLHALLSSEQLIENQQLQTFIILLSNIQGDILFFPLNLTFILTILGCIGQRWLALWAQTRIIFSFGAFAHQAQISNINENRFQKYANLDGEFVHCLSSGQCQLISIVRSLFKKAYAIVFDGTTDSWEQETQVAVQALDTIVKDVIKLIEAIRLTALQICVVFIRVVKDSFVHDHDLIQMQRK